MGDLGTAKRSLMWVKEAVSSGRWDNYESQVQKVEQALEGIPEAEKAAVVAELAELRGAAEKAQKDEKSGRLLRDIDRRISAIDPRSLVDSALIDKIEDVLKRLGADELKAVVEPDVIAQYVQKLNAMRPAAAVPPAPKAAPAPAATTPPPAATATVAAAVTSPVAVPVAMPVASPPPAPPAVVKAPEPSVDLGPVKREMMWLKDAAGSARWDRYEAQLEKVEGMLAAIAAADKAAIVAELETVKQEADRAQNSEKAGRIVDEINRKIRGNLLKQATERLDTDDAQALLEPAVVLELRGNIVAAERAAAAEHKTQRMERMEPLIQEYDELYGNGPFKDLDGDQVRRLYGDLERRIVAVQNNVVDLPVDDADRKRIEAKLADMKAKLDSAWAAWGEANAVEMLNQGWQLAHERFAEWTAESEGPTWQDFADGRGDHVRALNLPLTRRAIDECLYWLEHANRTKEEHSGNAMVAELIAGAHQVIETATGKLKTAFDKLMSGAEAAPLPTTKRDTDKSVVITHYVDGWFTKTPHLDPSVTRAKAFHQKWVDHVERLDREGAELYAKLESEAVKKWPNILSGFEVTPHFNPAEFARWKGKTVHFKDIRNRARWDFAGDFHFIVRVGDTPVAGDWGAHIDQAMDEVAERTRHVVDDHTDWDVVCVVEGTGKVRTRTIREFRVQGTNDVLKTETWEPEPCVTVRVVGLRAGPVALGPK